VAISSITALVATTMGAGSAPHVRYFSDLDGHNRATEAKMLPGQQRCRISYVMLGDERTVDSDTTYREYEITVWSHHLLALPLDERAWTEGAMDEYMRVLASPATWRAYAGVWNLPDGQKSITVIEPEREGNVITFGVRARVLVTV